MHRGIIGPERERVAPVIANIPGAATG